MSENKPDWLKAREVQGNFSSFVIGMASREIPAADTGNSITHRGIYLIRHEMTLAKTILVVSRYLRAVANETYEPTDVVNTFTFLDVVQPSNKNVAQEYTNLRISLSTGKFAISGMDIDKQSDPQRIAHETIVMLDNLGTVGDLVEIDPTPES